MIVKLFIILTLFPKGYYYYARYLTSICFDADWFCLISGIKVPAQQAVAPHTQAMSAQAPCVPNVAGHGAAVSGAAVAANVPQSRGFKPFSVLIKKIPFMMLS